MIKRPSSKRYPVFEACVMLLVAVSLPAVAEEKEGNLVRGAKAWANNCASCHNLRPAKEFRDDQWRVIMSHMRIRADLTGQETRDILKFLQENN